MSSGQHQQGQAEWTRIYRGLDYVVRTWERISECGQT